SDSRGHPRRAGGVAGGGQGAGAIVGEGRMTDRDKKLDKIRAKLPPPNGQVHDPATDPNAERLRGQAAREEPRGLELTSLAAIRREPVRWLVPGYVPLGKLVLIAGDGGHGKSTSTLNLVACLSRGWPCLGLQYEDAARAESLLVSCEDDYGDTVVPRLLAANA